MCTAVSLRRRSHYFGRNLDLEYSYEESVVITPRNYPLAFRREGTMETHYAMIGMAYVYGGYPLYYDAMNERGLCIAGLNFPESACYHKMMAGKRNIAPFEWIPWILGQCGSVEEAERLLENTNILEEAFCEELPLTPLHWMLSDAKESIAIEPLCDGVKIRKNPVGIITNEPPLEYHLLHLRDFMGLSSAMAENRFSPRLDMRAYSRGMGAMGLPGDFSSASRFVRATFVKENMPEDVEGVEALFEILRAVSVPRGSVYADAEKYQFTIYSSCCDAERGIYYYTTAENFAVSCVDMYRENLDGSRIVSYPIACGQMLRKRN